MKFMIHRTSGFPIDYDKKQYEIDKKTLNQNALYDKYADRRIEIEVNSLEELLELYKKYGSLIINNSEEGYIQLEIYDEYRE